MAARKKSAADRLLAVDEKTRRAVMPYRDTLAVKALTLVSDVGDQPQMLSLSGGVLLSGLVAGDRRLVRAGARMIAAHLVATGIKNFVKARVDRTRPRSAKGRNGHKPKLGRKDTKEETSFPSGHSAGALAVARAFSRELPNHRGAALTGAGVIAFAQIPRCAHYPTDVGAGLAIGWLSELAVDRAARHLFRPAWL